MSNERLIPNWPQVLSSALSEEDEIDFLKRKQAVELRLIDKARPCDVEKICGIRSSRQKIMLERCESLHADGRPWGYRALIPNSITKYERKKSENSNNIDGRGKSGLFQELLDRNGGEVRQYVAGLYWDGEQQPNGSYRMLSADDIHSSFLKYCQKMGIMFGTYPFSTVDQCKRAIYRFLNELRNQDQVRALGRDFGDDIATAFHSDAMGIPIRKARFPTESVQLDGHQLDCDGDVEIDMPSGIPVLLPLDMVYTVDLISEDKSIVFGHFLALSGNYNQEDVQRCFGSAMGISRDGEFRHCDYLPHHFIPELKWIAFNQAKLDRFMAHQGSEIQKVLIEVLNSRILYDEAHTPRKRPHIEALFTALEKKGISRLSSAHKPGGVQASKNESRKAAKRSCIRWQDLEATIQETYRDRLLAPNQKIEGRSQLDYLKAIVTRDLASMRTVPQTLQERLNILRKTFEVVVRGDPKMGRRPHVNIAYGDYRGMIISRSGAFVGKKITCVGDIEDARVLEAYLDGQNIDRLHVQSPWNARKHTFETRERAMQAFRKNGIKVKDLTDGTATYEEILRGKIAKPAPNTGKEIARLHREKDESSRVVKLSDPVIAKVPGVTSPPLVPRIRKTVRLI